MLNQNQIRTLLVFLFCILSQNFIYSYNKPCYNCPDYIKDLIIYGKKYDFINYNYNQLQWNEYAAVDKIFKAFSEVDKRKVKIVHIGDSHVQAGVISNEISKRLQSAFGSAGKGMIFPYSAASTHSTMTYTTRHYGSWASCKNVNHKPTMDLGLAGATIRTYDKNAWFSIKLHPSEYNDQNKILKIYRKYSDKQFDLKVSIGGMALPVNIPAYSDPESPFVTVILPRSANEVNVYMVKSAPNQTLFECYGLSLESDVESGVLYHSVGINGANFQSILNQNLMGEELKEIDPDLVLIDLGTNDFGYAGINAIDYEMKLTKVIEKIRNSSPNASILITSPQDFQFYGGYAPECIKAAEVSKKVAFANKCVFLDGFSITGGKSSIMKWLKNGLSQYDRIHLNIPGYAVKGELYVNAILNSYYYYLQNGKLAKNDLPIFNSTNSNIANVTPVVDNTKTYTPTKIVEKEDVTSMIKYKVKLGDYLGKISEEHNVSLTDLKKWNDLTSNKIYVNQTLTIYTKKSPVNTKINIENNKPKTIVENKSKEPEKKVVSNPTITKTNTKTAPTSSKPTLSKTALTTSSKPSTTTASKTPVTSVKKAKWNDINSLLYDSYTMKYGDSLWSVSRAYGMTVDELKKLNNIKEGQMLHPGTVLLVKAK